MEDKAHPKRHLKILSTPDIHSRIVTSEIFEIFSTHGEQTASHRWRPGNNRTGIQNSSIQTSISSDTPSPFSRSTQVAAKSCVQRLFQRHYLAFATEIKSIQLYDSITMASPWDNIVYITLHTDFFHGISVVLLELPVLYKLKNK